MRRSLAAVLAVLTAAFELIAIVLPSALALFSAFPDPGERDA